jgi:hypothetical protein
MGRQTLVSNTLGLAEGLSVFLPLARGPLPSTHGAAPNLVSILASSARGREANDYCTTRFASTARESGDRIIGTSDHRVIEFIDKIDAAIKNIEGASVEVRCLPEPRTSSFDFDRRPSDSAFEVGGTRNS